MLDNDPWEVEPSRMQRFRVLGLGVESLSRGFQDAAKPEVRGSRPLLAHEASGPRVGCRVQEHACVNSLGFDPHRPETPGALKQKGSRV